jgi:AraC family transcriptional activator of pobA
MRKSGRKPYVINSISELHRIFSLPKPEHPLVSIIDLKQTHSIANEIADSIVFNFYSVWLEKDASTKLRYGQQYFDFEEGSMIFIAPGQVLSTYKHQDFPSGWGLVFHPDFIQNYPLAKTIKTYGYFSYAVNEGLHLSEKEETIITNLIKNIRQEYRSMIDQFSQDLIIAHMETLLKYCDRFYNRQFLTRKNAGNDLLSQIETLLSEHFNAKKDEQGLPTVSEMAASLHVSPNYLSDMLRSQTGQSARHYIHDKLIEKAKELISTTSLSVSEIAFQLGFEHPQSFHKLFKNKTKLSPLEFRQSFN